MMHYYTEVLSKYAVFTGRARRAEYWYFALANILIYIALWILNAVPVIRILSSTALFIYGIAMIVPTVAVSVRRLHDTGRSGWWLLIGLIPIVGAIVLLIFYVTEGTPGENEYGPNPKGVAAATPPPAQPA